MKWTVVDRVSIQIEIEPYLDYIQLGEKYIRNMERNIATTGGRSWHYNILLLTCLIYSPSMGLI